MAFHGFQNILPPAGHEASFMSHQHVPARSVKLSQGGRIVRNDPVQQPKNRNAKNNNTEADTNR
jgi:hypothetical protein